MGKQGKLRQKRDITRRNSTTKRGLRGSHDDHLDDQIDAFHKQRDVVPLEINDNANESDEEDQDHPVFDFESVKDEDDDVDDDDDEIEDDTQLTGLAAKIARQQKYLRAKLGGVEDEMHDDAEDGEDKRTVWGRRKNIYYSADNVDYELQSSDEELPAEEEAEVLRLQKEKAKSLSMEDYGLEDDVSQDESDGEPTMEEILVRGKTRSKTSADKDDENDIDTTFEEVKKDLNALTQEEQMDVVYSSAPELVGLLSELNDALEQLESKVNPLLSKVRAVDYTRKGGVHYFQVKQLLLIAYCQAITFYLLLKSEGQPVRDHPVIARLVEIKNLLDKMKQLDENLPSELEEILEKQNKINIVGKLVTENSELASDSLLKGCKPTSVVADAQEAAVPPEAPELVKADSLKDYGKKREKRKHQVDQVGLQSMEMLKLRAELENKLKQKGFFSSIAPMHDKAPKHLQPVNAKLETLNDFDDEAVEMEGDIRAMSNGHTISLHPSKLSQLVTPKMNKPKIALGDDDLPMRDDIGERRRKHEIRVLAGAGINSIDEFEDEPGTLESNGDADMEDVEMEGPEIDLYKQAEIKRAGKLAANAEMYSRTSTVPSLPETTLVDGKRHISRQMEKNRGLTRARKKLTKNPRKKYKLKHQKAVVRRKGQVREIKRPSGPYGGESSGINAGISRSIRFKN